MNKEIIVPKNLERALFLIGKSSDGNLYKQILEDLGLLTFESAETIVYRGDVKNGWLGRQKGNRFLCGLSES